MKYFVPTVLIKSWYILTRVEKVLYYQRHTLLMDAPCNWLIPDRVWGVQDPGDIWLRQNTQRGLGYVSYQSCSPVRSEPRHLAMHSEHFVCLIKWYVLVLSLVRCMLQFKAWTLCKHQWCLKAKANQTYPGYLFFQRQKAIYKRGVCGLTETPKSR